MKTRRAGCYVSSTKCSDHNFRMFRLLFFIFFQVSFFNTAVRNVETYKNRHKIVQGSSKTKKIEKNQEKIRENFFSIFYFWFVMENFVNLKKIYMFGFE